MRMNPEANLPYRALQILSRPKQPEGKVSSPGASISQTAHAAFPSAARQESSPRYSASHPGKPSPQDSLFHFVVRTRYRSRRTCLSSIKHRACSTETFPSIITKAPRPASHSRGRRGKVRRQETNPEQKQKLLSLFGKPQASPTGLSTDDKGKGKAKEPLVMYDQAQPSSVPRSRVASIAGSGDVGSATMSRQNSQTPISPADRSFLLDYLQHVSNSGP